MLLVKLDYGKPERLSIGGRSSSSYISRSESRIQRSSLQLKQNQSSISESNSTRTFPLILTHLGSSGGVIVLHTQSEANRTSWIKAIEAQKQKLIDSKTKFRKISLTNFGLNNKVNCCTWYQGKLLVGTDFGVFISMDSQHYNQEENRGSMTLVKVIDIEKVNQVDIISSSDMLLVLAEKTFVYFPLSVIESKTGDSEKSIESENGLEAPPKGKKIASNVSFFKQGVCKEKRYICAVKSSQLGSTVKLLEPVGLETTKLRGIGRFFKSQSEPLHLYKELFIPTESSSIHFLKTTLCVGCSKGFEIVELETLNTQGNIF